MPTRRRALFILFILALGALMSLSFALALGSVPLSMRDIVSSFLNNGDSTAQSIIFSLRLPRALSGFACGALLAISGALLQVLLRNPLADPYILGISGGASVGALIALFLGLGLVHTHSASFIGALIAMLLVFSLAHGDMSWTQTRLLLTGVIVAAGCGATVALILSLAPDDRLRGMLFWLMGDLSQSNSPLWIMLALALVMMMTLPFARELNLLSRGADIAQTLGVKVTRVRLIIYVIASLATAAAVTQAGAIGFIGLVIPHLIRLSLGNDQRLLLPASALAGGSLLVIADTLARTIIAPQQLPVGVLTALIGVPVFLFLLTRESGGRKR